MASEAVHTSDVQEPSTAARPLATELDFYGFYPWSPYPVLDWQTNEVVTNIFLLSCGLLNAVEEFVGAMNSLEAAEGASRIHSCRVGQPCVVGKADRLDPDRLGRRRSTPAEGRISARPSEHLGEGQLRLPLIFHDSQRLALIGQSCGYAILGAR